MQEAAGCNNKHINKMGNMSLIAYKIQHLYLHKTRKLDKLKMQSHF